MDLEADILDAPTQNDTPKSQYQKKKKKRKVKFQEKTMTMITTTMVYNSPDQTTSNQIELIHFIKELNPSKARQIKNKT